MSNLFISTDQFREGLVRRLDVRKPSIYWGQRACFEWLRDVYESVSSLGYGPGQKA